MKVVDETKSVREIEEKIGYGLVEELIYAAHNELKLIRIMKHWRPWETLFAENSKEFDINMMNLRNDNPFPTNFERFDNMRNDRPDRRPTAGIHPEDEEK